jgi:hypothetical protein
LSWNARSQGKPEVPQLQNVPKDKVEAMGWQNPPADARWAGSEEREDDSAR